MALTKASPVGAQPRRTPVSIRPHIKPLAPIHNTAQSQPDMTSGLCSEQDGSKVPQRQGRQGEGALSRRSSATNTSRTHTVGSHARLAKRRRLSTILTPTASEASCGETGSGSIESTQMLGFSTSRPNDQHNKSSDDGYRPTIDEALAGQGNWMAVATDTGQDVEMVSNGPSEEEVQHNSTSPWSPLKNHGGRRGGLSREQAEQASRMRKTGACLKCRMFRIKCGEGDPCPQCRRKTRNWRLGCTRDLLEHRFEFLYPKILASHVQEADVMEFINSNTTNWLGPPFHLPLTQELGGRPLYIVVREAELASMRLSQRSAFITVHSNDNPTDEAIDLISPPLLPYWGKDQGGRAEYEQTVGQTLQDWLQRMIEGSDWHQHCFDDPEENLWERDILAEICAYHREKSTLKSGHEGLESGLRLTFLVHMLTHPFAIPTEKAADILGRLCQPAYHVLMHPRTEVSPLGVNKFLAMYIFPRFEEVATETLRCLSTHLTSRTNTEAATELAFCEAFLILFVLGQCQISVLNHARAAEKRLEYTFTTDMASSQISQMENQLARHIIELCICKFRKETKFRAGSTAPASCMSPFFNRLLQITSKYGEISSRQTELGQINLDNFGATNVRRLLTRLYQSVSGFWGPLNVQETDEQE